jgi:GT2 family glycosyltransferase
MLRASAVRQVGGARADFPECAPEDLALRVIGTAGSDHVRHIPRVLMSQHVQKSWTSRFKPAWRQRMRPKAWSRLVEDRHCDAPPPRTMAISGSALFRIVYPLPARKPLVSVIIPTRDKLSLLRTCIDGLVQRTEYRPIEIIVVNNRSEEPATLSYLSDLATRPDARVVDFDADFNWGEINNAGVKASRGEIALLLNNDTDVVQSDWLTELAAQAMRPEVGIVGAKLLYQNHTVQHAGLVLGPDGHAFHRFRHVPDNEPGYDDALATVRNVTAVTGACLAIRRNVFDEIGGIESQDLAVTWSDVDLCLRARARGYRVIVTPFARLMHLELATRGADDTPERQARADRERDYMLRKWPSLLEEDRFFNANFKLGEGNTRLETPPRLPHRTTAKDD